MSIIQGDLKPKKTQLIEVANLIKPWIHRTPVVGSTFLNKLSGADLYFKCEQLQRMGAFKMRGAVSALSVLSDEQRAQGVVTHSSGNFGQAVALAAKLMGIKAYVVMPLGTPKVKRDAVIGYGAEVTDCAPNLAAREQATQEIIQRTGATALHPSNTMPVILGNATATMELLEEVPDLNGVIAPVGGGGLLAGTALAAAHFGNNCQCWGAEPSAVDDAYRSLKMGSIQSNDDPKTIADGLKTQLGSVNFPIIQKGVSAIYCVEESEIVAAMRLLWERTKMVVEPSSAVVLAAVLKYPQEFSEKKIGLILSGGNVDLSRLPF
jgi:threonine dehydratase